MSNLPPRLPEMPPPLPPLLRPPPLMALPVLDETELDSAGLNCPLCGYHLRGLAKRRCPECGHAFDPAELRRVKEGRGEWRFENARRGRVRSFVLTSLATFRPFKFWRDLTAADTIVPGRLTLWARGWLAVATASVVASMSLAVVLSYIDVQSRLAAGGTQFARGGGFFGADPTFAGAATRVVFGSGFVSNLEMMFAILIWPLMAVLASQFFGHTLRRASIHRGHLWRCVLYAWPVMALPCVLFLVAAPFLGLNHVGDAGLPRIAWQLASIWGFAPLAFVVTAIAAALSTIHLVAAHVRYLRLPQAAMQAVLVQAVAWLSIVAIIHLCAMLRDA